MSKPRIQSLEALDDYVTGTMPETEADAFEEELFAAATTGTDADARWFDRFHRLMARIGPSEMLIRATGAADVAELRKHGVRVHVVELGAGGKVDYTVPESAVDVIVSKLSVDVRPYDDVVATIENPDGTVLHTFRDCLGEPGTGNLYALCAAPLARKSLGAAPRVTRITGVRKGASTREQIALFETTPVPIP